MLLFLLDMWTCANQFSLSSVSFHHIYITVSKSQFWSQYLCTHKSDNGLVWHSKAVALWPQFIIAGIFSNLSHQLSKWIRYAVHGTHSYCSLFSMEFLLASMYNLISSILNLRQYKILEKPLVTIYQENIQYTGMCVMTCWGKRIWLTQIFFLTNLMGKH